MRPPYVSIPFIAGQWSLPWRWHGRPGSRPTSFNPLHCGAVVASHSPIFTFYVDRARFQSPSLRGSGRFRRRVARLGRQQPRRFNPLHCGAVVASLKSLARLRSQADQVSIPFIAGQWSLHARASVPVPGAVPAFQSPSLRGSGRFASARAEAEERARQVSIPFIAGQWSLRRRGRRRQRAATPRFQSPSLRGSGRFAWTKSTTMRRRLFQSPSLRGSGRFRSKRGKRRRSVCSFNPLHCGAVVASAARVPAGARAATDVSIPFIAGQWSLPGGGGPRARAGACFNPLHCGAVVASTSRSPTGGPGMTSFNPLHCGAVVASSPPRRRR